jgi:predicted ATPase with chaperone activity
MPERSQAQRQPSSKSASCFQTHKMQRKCEEVRLFQREHRGQLADFPNRLLPQRLLYETSGCSELELLNHIHYLESLSLSTRSITTVLRVARTLADFSFSEKIKDFHLHKAACLHHSMITKEFGGLY